jgi:hypothetical protein
MNLFLILDGFTNSLKNILNSSSYFLKSFSISSIGSASFENKSNPSPSTMTGLSNIIISTILIGTEAQSSAKSSPPEQAE